MNKRQRKKLKKKLGFWLNRNSFFKTLERQIIFLPKEMFDKEPNISVRVFEKMKARRLGE